MCRLTRWSARAVRQPKWSTSPTMLGMHCTFNRRSVGVEMGGFASCGFDAPQLATIAHVFAFLCYHLQIPVRQARLASDRALPRTKISSLRAAVITIRPTTRASCRDYSPSRR